MPQSIQHIKLLITSVLMLVFTSINAQEIRIIDNKGTIQTVNNNNVYSQNLDPVTNAPLITPVENDIWINTTPTPDQAKIWDGTNWVDLTLNVYNIDGILSNNRTVDGSASEFDLTFRNLNGRFTSSSRFDIDNIDLVLFSSLTNFTVQNSNRAMFSGLNQFTIQTTANVSLTSTGPFNINAANTTLSGNIVVPGTYTATSGGVGTANQILSSTGTGTNWIDNTKNTVTTSDTTPTTPIENDIWFETNSTNNTVSTYGHTLIKIYNGTNWVELVPKASRIFYPPSIVVDTSGGIGSSGTYDLHALYEDEFTNAMVSSDPVNAPSIPTYTENELYYYITKYDTDVFENVQITTTGILTYDVKGTPTDDNTIFNVVFVVK